MRYALNSYYSQVFGNSSKLVSEILLLSFELRTESNSCFMYILINRLII